MDPVEEIRRENLLALIAECGGSQRALAERIGKAPAQISQWVTRAPTQSGRPRVISGPTARDIEAAMGKPVGWMDTRHRSGVAEEAPTPYLRPISVWENPDDFPPDQMLLLPRLDYHLSAGNGGPDPNAVERTDKAMPFQAGWARVQGWSPRTHFTMRAKGVSMEPTIQDGAPVVIDTSAAGRVVRSGKVYAILVDGDPLLKRLDKLPGGRIRVRSDNPAPDYASFDVADAELEIIGRAVWTPTLL